MAFSRMIWVKNQLQANFKVRIRDSISSPLQENFKVTIRDSVSSPLQLNFSVGIMNYTP